MPTGHLFEQALGVGDGQGSLSCCSPWGCKESDMTERLNETESLGFKYLFLGEGFSLRTNISRCVGKLSWELL